MSVRRLAAAAAALVVAAVLLGPPLTSGASWSQSATLGTGTITAGRLTVLSGTTSADAVKSYRFTGLDAAAVGPGAGGGAVQAPLTVSSGGDIDYVVRLSGATQSSTALAGSLLLRVVQVTSASACPATGDPTGTTLYSGALEGASTAYGGTLAPTASTVYCVRVRFDPASTNAQAGQTSSVVLTFTARQARNG
ncbi:hypothetical protein [Solicola sp. PLA-1-18]|uniref:hypothetical protein n=1 Tax=Solicola sp. PLA-1-18 TaxID=3380532 RepID=UPI003B7FABA8